MNRKPLSPVLGLISVLLLLAFAGFSMLMAGNKVYASNQATPTPIGKEAPLGRFPFNPGGNNPVTPGVESLVGLNIQAVLPAVGVSFDAVDEASDNNGYIHTPPDTHAAAGPSSVIEVTNGHVAIYNKTGGVIAGGTGSSGVSLNAFCGISSGCFDPKIIYDQYENRFVAVALDGDDYATSKLHVIVSKTSNPLNLTSDWDKYTYTAGTTLDGTQGWFDYPGLGVSPDAVVVTGNIFSDAGYYQGGKIRIFDKSKLYAGNSSPYVDLDLPYRNPHDTFTLQPAHHFGSPPANTFYLIQQYNSSNLEVWSLTGMPGSSSSLPTITKTFVSATTQSCWTGSVTIYPTQKGTALLLDGVCPRMMNAVWRNGSLWATFTGANTGTPTRTVVQWFEIQTNNYPAASILSPASSPTLKQQGTIDAGTGTHTFMPSIGVDACNNMLITYTQSGTNDYPTMMVSGRYSTDTLNGLRDPLVVNASTNYHDDFSGSRGYERWGDYSAVSIDPSDGKFWVAHEYSRIAASAYGNDGRWGTWIASLDLECSSTEPTPTATGPTPTATVPTSTATVPAPTATVTPAPGGKAIYFPLVVRPVSSITPTPNPASLDLTISAVKVIQGTTFDSAPSNAPDVVAPVYIANRATTVRVFVNTSSGSVSGVKAILRGYDSNGTELSDSPLSPTSASITAPSLESDMAKTLNFSLPAGWIKPNYSYKVVINQDYSVIESNYANNIYPASGTQAFGFVAVSDLNIVLVPVNYTPAGSSTTYSVYTTDHSYLSWLPIKVYPVSTINYTWHSPVTYAPSDAAYNMNQGNGWSALLNQITSVHTGEGNSNKVYYGVVNFYDAHGCSGGCIVGLGWLGSPSSIGFSGWGDGSVYNYGKPAGETITHEIGHNFNRHHVFCTGSEAGVDPNYPYAGGSIGTWGLDVATGTLYNPNTYKDYMSYCNSTWTSNYTFQAIKTYRDTHGFDTARSDTAMDALYISGTIHPDGQITLYPVFRQNTRVNLFDTGSHNLELLDGNGNVLSSFAFTPVEIGDLDGYSGFGFFVPSVQGYSGYRITKAGVVLAERILRAPKAAALSTTGETIQLTSGNTLSWNGAFANASVLRYRIRFSKDGGETWTVLAVDYGWTELTIPAGVDLSGSMVEVQGSDGVHVATQTISFE